MSTCVNRKRPRLPGQTRDLTNLTCLCVSDDLLLSLTMNTLRVVSRVPGFFQFSCQITVAIKNLTVCSPPSQSHSICQVNSTTWTGLDESKVMTWTHCGQLRMCSALVKHCLTTANTSSHVRVEDLFDQKAILPEPNLINDLPTNQPACLEWDENEKERLVD